MRDNMEVRDLKPGMSRVSMTVKVLENPEETQTITSGGVDHKILELEVGDESGSIKLVLWDERILSNLRAGDLIRVENGFVTSLRGVWRVNVGRYGTLARA
jgi:replication factor A1